MKVLLLFLISILPVISAEPTEVREWTSSVGSKIEGKAMGLSEGKVTLKTTAGRTLVLPLSKLSKEDGEFLLEHFKPEPLEAPSFEAPTLDHPLGEIVGPIEASDGSSYFLYLPKCLAAGADAPLFFFTGPNPSKKKTLERFISAAELTGMVLAASVESKNQENAFVINNGHTKNCLKHIKKTLPVDVERVFFSGTSGGGATSLYNASTIKCLGALPYIGYIPSGSSPTKKGFYYLASGAWDYNRYSSAGAAKQFKNRATHRMYSGGHTMGSKAIAEEGAIWLYTRHIYEKRDLFPEEATRFEVRLSTFLAELSEKDSQLAYYWTDHLLNLCEASGAVRPIIEGFHTKLASDPENVRYLAGRVALDDFSEDVFAPVDGKGSLSEHTTPNIQTSAQKLVDEYSDVPAIKEIAEGLLKKTHKF